MSHRGSFDIQIVSRIPGIPAAGHFRRWLKAALPASAEMTLRVVNSTEARALNRTYRGKDYATNVLTFVYHKQGAKQLSGDIVVCAQVVAREAREQGKSLDEHYAHMTIHGALHLAGMDHESAGDAQLMERRETKTLREFGFRDPYA